MENFAAIDFETANGKRTSVCSVGIVVVRNGEVTDEFYSLIRPYPNYYTKWTTAIHGLTFDDTHNAPTFDEVWAKASKLVEGLPLVAHNSRFDEGCLKAVHKLYDIYYPNYEFHCTCVASRRAFPGLVNHKLDTVAAACGFILENHHNAIADAEACAAIAKKIL